VVREHAERITKDKIELSEQVKNLTEEQKESQRFKALVGLMYEVQGMTFASDVLNEFFGILPQKPQFSNLLVSEHTFPAYSLTPIGDAASAIISSQTKIQQRIESRLETIKTTLKAVPNNEKLNRSFSDKTDG
jgi:hypothetical protein